MSFFRKIRGNRREFKGFSGQQSSGKMRYSVTTILTLILCCNQVLLNAQSSTTVDSGQSSSSTSQAHHHLHQRHQQHQQHQQQQHSPKVAARSAPQRLCRDRFGSYEVSTFLRVSCYFCRRYLFPTTTKPSSPNGTEGGGGGGGDSSSPEDPSLPSSTPSAAGGGQRRRRSPPLSVPFEDDFASYSSASNGSCRSLSAPDCRRWRACCSAAEQCCVRQVNMMMSSTAAAAAATGNASSDGDEDDFRCKITWDGFSCWDSGRPGTYERQRCPEFMLHSNPSERSLKYCTPNATWFKRDGSEWTDYTPCVNATYRFHLNAVYTCFAFNALSISMLLPSIGIFLTFRDLAKQPRVRLHVNFFAALVLCCFTTIVWYLFVHYERLNNPDQMDTVIYRNPVWCRLIAFLKTYFTSTTYFWMFCEGWYLYRLLSKAFQQPESLRSLYLIGWGCPALTAAVYCSIRSVIDNSECWVKHVGDYEWIIYTPNLLCLILNFVFLCNILRILLFQLHSHPQEPSNFRRGLKAGIMLIPLFGLQLLLTIYRPELDNSDHQTYEYLTLAITNSQGVFVSLIFCFLNGEVMSHVCRSGVCGCILRRSRMSHKYASHTTQVTMTEDRRNDTPNTLKNRTTCRSSCGGGGEEFCLQDLTAAAAAASPSAATTAAANDYDGDATNEYERLREGGVDASTLALSDRYS